MLEFTLSRKGWKENQSMSSRQSILESNPTHDVHVEAYELQDHPARVKFTIRVGVLKFFSEVTYHSIPSWDALWQKYTPALVPRLLGLIAAWDSMRFLALGGQRLVLCEGLDCDVAVRATWSKCFRSQFGEWRYRNQISYPDPSYPLLVAPAPPCSQPMDINAPEPRWLLTNGGGKDTLASLMLLSSLDTPFDFYEGCLPIGGTHDRQDELLCRLRTAAVGEGAEVRKVSIRDDFAERDDADFARAGVEAEHFKTDFAVGHTANYIGYFPVILYHGYTQLWFNIEKSADDAMVIWDGEPINHQWCKSTEYHRISLELFRSVCGQHWFEGFSSPLRGLYDTSIYKVVSQRPDLLEATHSCNYGKPWCGKCTKCLFCYLMMTAYVDEAFAQQVLGAGRSLFADEALRPVWEDLLSPKKVAWECVPSHEECQLAVRICLSRGLHYPLLLEYAASPAQTGRLWARFSAVDWDKVPEILVGPLRALLAKAQIPLVLDAIVVGAGQAGLSASYLLQQREIPHVVLEAGDIAQAWRNRWDSFQLNTPNMYTHLPGMTYDGTEPDGFAGKHEVAEFMVRYASHYKLPVVTRCKVLEARREGVYYKVSTPEGTWRVRALVVASGHYAQPFYPPAASKLPPFVKVLHSSQYRNVGELPKGGVLVVGGGQSGVQIAEDLNDAGKKVFWSISDRPCNYRRYRGEDFMHWWEVGGIQHRAIEEHPSIMAGEPDAKRKLRRADFPLVSGKGKEGRGHSISYKALWESGITLLGRFDSASYKHVGFRSDVRDNVASAHRATRNIREELDRIASEFSAVAASEVEDFLSGVDSDWVPPDVVTTLSLSVGEVASVVFATGYEHGWPWLKVNRIADEMGYPLGDHGVHPIPGLYFLGLFNQQRLSSICLCNGGRDAEPVVNDIQVFLEQWHRISKLAAQKREGMDSAKRQVLAVALGEQEESQLKFLSNADMQFHHYKATFSPPGDCASGDLLTRMRECILYSRIVGIDAVFALDCFSTVVAAAVSEDLELPGPSVESVLVSMHENNQAGMSEQYKAAFQRFVDTIKYPLERSDRLAGVSYTAPTASAIEVLVIGWSDSNAVTHAWSSPGRQTGGRSAVIAAARAVAALRGVRAAFWTARVLDLPEPVVAAFSVGTSEAGASTDQHMVRAALALCCGYEAEARTLADAMFAESQSMLSAEQRQVAEVEDERR